MPAEESSCNTDSSKESILAIEDAPIEPQVEAYSEKCEKALEPELRSPKAHDEQQTLPELSSTVKTEPLMQTKKHNNETKAARGSEAAGKQREKRQSRPHIVQKTTMSELEALSPTNMPPLPSELEAPIREFPHFLNQGPLMRGGPIPSPTPPPEEDETSSPKSRVLFPATPTIAKNVPHSGFPPTPPPSAPREERSNRTKRVNFVIQPNSAGGPKYTPFGFRLDGLRLAALDKAQRFWELQNDVSTGGAAPSEREARLEMLGRDLISDLHSLIEQSVALENILKDERWKVWSTGTAVAAGIPAFCFLTQYSSLPFTLDPSKWTSSLPSLPSKTISTLHSVPAHPVARAAGRAAGVAVHAGGKAAGKAATAAHEGFMALSAATMALSLVPTAIGIIEVAFHERKLGDVQSWTDDLRNLSYRVGSGETVDGMDMYCLSDERWDELPWKSAEEDTRDLCY